MNHSRCSQLSFHWTLEEQIHAGESPPLIIRTCRHILGNGRFCRAAAVRGRRYCRAHGLLRLRQRRMARTHRKLAAVKLPRLIDLRAVEAAHKVARTASATGHMDAACARLVHQALRQVASAMRFIAWQKRQTRALGNASGRALAPNRQHGP